MSDSSNLRGRNGVIRLSHFYLSDVLVSCRVEQVSQQNLQLLRMCDFDARNEL
ncbi:hypothetical protein J6590_024213 [Homalodisca vitripennis]|nr:hypothetical protein J6590_024213 [Homalodisca vitripennis]